MQAVTSKRREMAYRGGANDSRRVMNATGTAVTGLQSIPLRSASRSHQHEIRDALIAQVDVM